MNRKAISFLMPIFAIAVGILLVTTVVAYLSYDNDGEVRVPKLGVDQEAIFGAYAMQDSIKLYAQTAAHQAVKNVATQEIDDLEDQLAAEFSHIMRKHPGVPASARFKVERAGDIYKFTPQNPITFTFRAGQLDNPNIYSEWDGGLYSQWPLEIRPETMILTCAYGHRDLGRGTKNHAGIDLSADVGDAVLSIAPGEVIRKNYSSDYVEVLHAGGWTCRYIHVDPGDQQVGDTVQQGERIATIARYSGGAHLDLRCYNHEDALTREEAEGLFGVERVNNANTDTSISPYGIHIRGNIYTDPYCLFEPALREQITHPYQCGNQLNRYRRDGNLQHKLLETCEVYAANNLFEVETDQPTLPTDDNENPLTGASILIENEENLPLISTLPTQSQIERWVRDTTNALRNNQAGGLTHLELVNQIAAQEAVDKKLILAMITIESKGQPGAVSPTGVCGLMQVTKATADEVLEEYEGSHCDARNSITAGTLYIKQVLQQFSQHREPLAIMAAAYNGGPGRLSNAIEATGQAQPTFVEISRELDAEEEKNIEIINHAVRFTRVYSYLGGEEIPLSSTLNGRVQATGQYTFDFETEITLTQQVLDQIRKQEELKQLLSNTPASRNDLIEEILRNPELDGILEGLQDCSTPATILRSTTQQCTEQYSGDCACPIEILPEYERIEFTNADVGYLVDGEEIESTAEWLGIQEDPDYVRILTQSQSDLDYSLPIRWSLDAPNEVRVGADRISITENKFYIEADISDELAKFYVSGDANSCQVQTPRVYCNEHIELEILHATE